MFLPSGRIHAIGAGNVIVEIQQNSDTTYRVFDWNRTERGEARQLHIEQSLRCIDFEDVEPSPTRAEGESLVRHELFQVDKWQLEAPRPAADQGRFAVICCLSGAIECGGVQLAPGYFLLVPAASSQRELVPLQDDTSLLRITIDA
jgi:mannose-6-phosphate isomerase